MRSRARSGDARAPQRAPEAAPQPAAMRALAPRQLAPSGSCACGRPQAPPQPRHRCRAGAAEAEEEAPPRQAADQAAPPCRLSLAALRPRGHTGDGSACVTRRASESARRTARRKGARKASNAASAGASRAQTAAETRRAAQQPRARSRRCGRDPHLFRRGALQCRGRGAPGKAAEFGCAPRRFGGFLLSHLQPSARVGRQALRARGGRRLCGGRAAAGGLDSSV